MLNLDRDIPKVGHHGSQYSCSPAFLEAVSPAVSVIEVGADNDYSHPAPEALSALRNAGSATKRTDLDSNIGVTADGKSFFATTKKAASIPHGSLHREILIKDNAV